MTGCWRLEHDFFRKIGMNHHPADSYIFRGVGIPPIRNSQETKVVGNGLGMFKRWKYKP